MKNNRRKNSPLNGNTGNGKNGRRHELRGEPPLTTANLGSPIFVESWNGGSPLNWVEFMGRWEITRSDRKASKREE